MILFWGSQSADTVDESEELALGSEAGPVAMAMYN